LALRRGSAAPARLGRAPSLVSSIARRSRHQSPEEVAVGASRSRGSSHPIECRPRSPRRSKRRLVVEIGIAWYPAIATGLVFSRPVHAAASLAREYGFRLPPPG